MNLSRITTMAQVREFLSGTPEVEMRVLEGTGEERYRHVQEILKRFGYGARSKVERGQLLSFLRKTSGFSRAQLTRLVTRALSGQRLEKRYGAPSQPFARRYLAEDVALLSTVDRAFGTLSGPATVHVLRRAFEEYGDRRFERLSGLSVSHLYNLRASAVYQRQRVVRTKTQGSAVTIGIRRAPTPDGRAGFIRIDSVHQGDHDGIKGVYHINAVDCVTQWEVLGCCERLSEAHLLPVIGQILECFPFQILGFHADNGSEYINHQVAQMLDKLHVEFTRSRPRHSNDNGLAETKNAAIVRKTFGYQHIAQHFATAINRFNREHLIPFINLHRPCLFAVESEDPKKPGRIRKRYPHRGVMTPLEKLISLEEDKRTLPNAEVLGQLRKQAGLMSDLQAAQKMNEAHQVLFRQISKRKTA